jgi:hypothetical protein
MVHLFGSTYRLTEERGTARLRAPDEEQRHLEYEKFVADLKKVHRLWKSLRK